MESLFVMGYHIPKDISIGTLGEDNWDKLNNFQHVISTSRQSFFLGTKAAQILYSQIQTPKLAIQQYIEYEDKFEPSYEPASVSYTHLDVYKRQINISKRFYAIILNKSDD